ncbi:MAG: GGDEF domain-containing protein [Ruminococcus sp.]|nr:GGDEF domain-containing protein [Ruminococcus sp.]
MIGGKKTVALCTARIYDPQVHQFIERFNNELSAKGIGLFVYALNIALYWNNNNHTPEAYVFDLIPYDKIDCLVLMDEKIQSKRIGGEIVKRARSSRVPVIVIDGQYEGTVSVCFDYERGFEKMVRHVIEFHKVRRPHFMAGIRNDAFSERRIDVFRRVLADNGIEYNDTMLSYGNYWAQPARKAARQLIDSGELPEAVICANDIMAINAAEVFKENGIGIPSQIIVTGFDGYDEARYVEPRISTMSCHPGLLAEAAAELIVQGKLSADSVSVHFVEPLEQFDESCGCHCVSNIEIIDQFNDKFYRYHDEAREFHDITVRIQMSDTCEKAMSCIRSNLMHDMCCIADKSCFRRDRNYFETSDDLLNARDLCVIYDSDEQQTGLREIGRADIIPNLQKRLDSGLPLIFNIIDYMNKPIGYVCYTFKDYNITDYSKTSKISSVISMGLGGFINMRYRDYLSEKLKEMYKNDFLTGLYNRTAFNAAFAEVRNDPENEGKLISIIMADIDGLKYINDTYGHDAGDVAISTSAAALRSSCPPGSLFLRFGGDELIAMVIGDCDEESILRRIEEYLKNFNAFSGLPYKVSASCGHYRTKLTESFEFESAVKLADKEMYIVKNARRKAGGQ